MSKTTKQATYPVGSYVRFTDGRVSDGEQFIVRAVDFSGKVESYHLEQFSNGRILAIHSAQITNLLLPA